MRIDSSLNNECFPHAAGASVSGAATSSISGCMIHSAESVDRPDLDLIYQSRAFRPHQPQLRRSGSSALEQILITSDDFFPLRDLSRSPSPSLDESLDVARPDVSPTQASTYALPKPSKKKATYHMRLMDSLSRGSPNEFLTPQTIASMKQAYRLFYEPGPQQYRLADVATEISKSRKPIGHARTSQFIRYQARLLGDTRPQPAPDFDYSQRAGELLRKHRPSITPQFRVKIINLVAALGSVAEVSKREGVTYASVRNWCWQAGIVPPCVRSGTQELMHYVNAQVHAGQSYSQLEKSTKRDRQTIRWMASSYEEFCKALAASDRNLHPPPLAHVRPVSDKRTLRPEFFRITKKRTPRNRPKLQERRLTE